MRLVMNAIKNNTHADPFGAYDADAEVIREAIAGFRETMQQAEADRSRRASTAIDRLTRTLALRAAVKLPEQHVSDADAPPPKKAKPTTGSDGAGPSVPPPKHDKPKAADKPKPATKTAEKPKSIDHPTPATEKSRPSQPFDSTPDGDASIPDLSIDAGDTFWDQKF